MRLDFNVVFVDDEYTINGECDHLDELIETIKDHLHQKGFYFKAYSFSSIKDCIASSIDSRRIDLYVSDYNLKETETGIDLYLQLKDKFICDFILYSKSNNEDILKQLINELNKELIKEQENEDSNPNLFSRFSFVARNSGTEWHEGITDILDHLISIREEMNTLRGLFAHMTAKMHQKLKDVPKIKAELGRLSSFEKESFCKAIEIAERQKVITKELKKFLTTQRDRRNAIVHNDELFDEEKGEYYIPYDRAIENQFNGRLYLNNFPNLRTKLRETNSQLERELNS